MKIKLNKRIGETLVPACKFHKGSLYVFCVNSEGSSFCLKLSNCGEEFVCTGIFQDKDDISIIDPVDASVPQIIQYLNKAVFPQYWYMVERPSGTYQRRSVANLEVFTLAHV